MQFTIYSAAAFASLVLADVSFTSFPKDVKVGEPVTLSYTSDHINEPVRIVLRQGPSKDLKDVQTITDSAIGGRYTWTPSNLPSGSDYALEIVQGSVMNYGTQFSIQGGSAPSASSSSTGSSSLSSIMTHMPIPLATGTGASHPYKTYGAGNHTTAAPSGTMPMAMATASGAASASGTGSPYKANTTFSSASLTASTTDSGSSAGSTGGAAATTAGSAKPSGNANGASQLGSSLALIGGAVAAFAFFA